MQTSERQEKEKQAAKQATEQATEQQFPLSVSAVMEYEEHRLAAGLVGRSTLRYYDKAEATIRIDKGEHRPALSPGRRPGDNEGQFMATRHERPQRWHGKRTIS